jgi:hypothetical protein
MNDLRRPLSNPDAHLARVARAFASLLLLAAFPGRLHANEQTTPAPRPWYERLRFSGDFRSRYEGFYQEDLDTRNRVRLRFRIRLDAEVNEDTRFELQLASGDPGTPVSTNQTFTEFFLPKPFSLDRAQIVYNPRAAKSLTLGLGKFSMPQATTQMVFDEDLNYEGGWEQVAWNVSEKLGVRLGSLQTAVNERGSAGDAYMLAGFGEVSVATGKHRLRFSAANYGWGDADQIALGSVDGPLESILTNALSFANDGTVVGYASRFNVIDAIAEATFVTGRQDYPLRVLADFAHNTRAATDRDSGIWVEAEYGRPRRAQTWGAGYTIARVEQDVTPSAFVFSDMPGTNVWLHMIKTSYVPVAGLSLDTTLHITKPLVVDAGPRHWLTRLHLAAVVRF